MDAEGFIPISLIASFYRVQALSQDQDVILQVCISSFELQYALAWATPKQRVLIGWCDIEKNIDIEAN